MKREGCWIEEQKSITNHKENDKLKVKNKEAVIGKEKGIKPRKLKRKRKTKSTLRR